MMVPLNVRRSTIAAHSLGSVKVFVQPEKDSFRGHRDGVVLLPLSQNLEEQLGAAAVQFHVSELVDHEEVDAAVAGDGASEVLLVRGFHELVHKPRGEGVFRPEPLLGRSFVCTKDASSG